MPPSECTTASDPDRLEELAQARGAPFHLFDADAVVRRVQAMRATEVGAAGVHYAVKANPNLGSLGAAHGSRRRCIASGGERAQAPPAGRAAAQMSFAGPAETDAELKAAIITGVGCISVEPSRGIDAYAHITKRRGRPAQIALGINLEARALRLQARAVLAGISFAICDGGLNHQTADAGAFGAALRGNFPLAGLSRRRATRRWVSVAGPSCNPTSRLGAQNGMPEAAVGDLVGVAMLGSQRPSASPMLFRSRDTSAEQLLWRSAVRLARRRHTIADIN